MKLPVRVSLVGVCVFFAACGGSSPEKATEPPAPTAQTSPAPTPGDDETLPPAVDPYAALPPEARSVIVENFKGDLDEMIKRRVIRAGVAVNRTHYFIDHGVQRGIAYDALTLFEDELNKKLKTGLLKVHVAFIPISRDQMFQALNEGRVDLLAAQLTVTPDREERVAFSSPTRSNVSEVLVTGPQAPAIATANDLSGQTVFVRRLSSYARSLDALSARLKAEGKAPVTIKE